MKDSDQFQSWGKYPKVSHREIQTPFWSSHINLNQPSLLAQGQARSYADACLNQDGTLIKTQYLNRALSLDTDAGLITAEAGMTLDEILKIIVPKGFFIPVSPGTKFVSLGGAIANDIHGKNHHGAGTFGRWVTRLSLLRSSGEILECSPTENADYFAATIAGIGLTGFILNATLKLIPITSAYIDQKVEKFSSLSEFFSISKSCDATYTVSWIDCLTENDGIGRGHFISGEHAVHGEKISHREPKISCPINLPSWALNRFSIQAFNVLYYHRLRNRITQSTVHYDPFFYPLDGVNHWNRMYGKNGFLQFQCVIPPSYKETGIQQILREAKKFGSASFLAVIKEFGSIDSPGLLSFPREGTTLTLDFAYKGERTVQLFKILEKIVMDCNGALYPAKDGLMSKESFHHMYPKLSFFMKYIDPKFSSSFSRRVL
jgi:FAD/FMN-containing dehydrogenase